jgi:FkbM family methyltransferase
MSFLTFDTPYGNICVPDNHWFDPVTHAIALNRVFEPYIIDCIRPFAKEGSIVIDAGANYGQMSLAFSQMVGPSGEVHAFEASNDIVKFLKETIKINNVSNIVLYHTALWHTSGLTLEMLLPDINVPGCFYSGQGVRGYNDPRPQLSHPIGTTTIDSINFSKPVSAIKIDVQGSDYATLCGAKNTILTHKPLIMFEYETFFDDRFDSSFQHYLRFLDEVGYEIRPDIINNNHDFACTSKS